jgi:hypothetical protein
MLNEVLLWISSDVNKKKQERMEKLIVIEFQKTRTNNVSASRYQARYEWKKLKVIIRKIFIYGNCKILE